MTRPETLYSSKLLSCGVIVGPLFLTTWLAQAMTRDGFDLTRHPLSLLALGEHGWIQTANFIVSGALLVAFAIGAARTMRAGRGRTWAPRLLAVNGFGLILAGIFPTDPGAGFPPGTPAGPPEHLSWHGILHEVGAFTAFIAWIVACVVLARRFAAAGNRTWLLACILTPLTVVILTAVPHADSLTVRLVVATALQLAWILAFALHLRTTQTHHAPAAHKNLEQTDRAFVPRGAKASDTVGG